MRTFLAIAFISTVFLLSCRKRDIQDPSYIRVTKPQMQVFSGQGTDSQDISHLDVLILENSEGIYAPPSVFPVLHTGRFKVECRPMIKWLARDGLHTYSMLTYSSDTLDLETLKVSELNPKFQYVSNVEFAWLEDFNDNDASLQLKSGTFDTFYVRNDPKHSYDGTPYLHIPMGNGEQFFEIESKDLFDLAMDGREVIMELHYKTNVPFTIGVFATSSSQIEVIPSVTPFDTEGEWKKGYVYLTDDIYLKGNDTRFRFFFRSANVEVTDPEIFIDNIKVLYRKG